MATLKKRNQGVIHTDKIAIKFDIKMLDMILKYLQSNYINMTDIGNVKRLFIDRKSVV